MTRAPDRTDLGVGQRVRMRRLALRMSQTVLGDRVGCTFQQIQKYEKGTNRIGAGRLAQIAGALGVPVSFFFEPAPQVGGSVRGDEVFELLATGRALRLLRNYSQITNPTIQAAIVDLVERVAESEQRSQVLIKRAGTKIRR
jgi:DNA-binding XRE family transcriptional regulator